MLTPRRLTLTLRLLGLGASVSLAILLLGPFQGLEAAFSLTDKEAHALAFFGVTLGLFAIAPNRRRTDLALVAVAFGVLIELAQGLTGRSMSLMDLTADCVGVLAATLPGLIERLRFYLRGGPEARPTTTGAATDPAITG